MEVLGIVLPIVALLLIIGITTVAAASGRMDRP